MSPDPPIDPASNEAAHWARVKSIMLEALDLPAAERAVFLERACGADAAVRAEVDALLASDEAAESLYEVPAAELITARAIGPRLPAGTRLGAYEIIDFVASGGMGDVYRAAHTVLGRVVALKTVSAKTPAGQADEAGRRRLLREARNAATLSHPGICTIHEVGETDDRPFIVMEYVDGVVLSALLRQRTLPLAEAIDYGVQIASALEHAHEHGILHRDLKSSNVMIAANGRAVVLDFGLAKRFTAGTGVVADATRTVENTLAGTLSHMAPEVLRGAASDVRSDVWALGVVLYELFSGVLPFAGATPYETTSAILEEAPRPLNARIPLALRLVIERCLLKDPQARYQSAGAVRAALEAIAHKRAWPLVGPLLVSVRRRSLQAAAAVVIGLPVVLVSGYQLAQQFTAPAISSVALLPLHNRTGDPAAQYYADGLTDALIAQLGELTGARVIPRAAAARLAGAGSRPAELGRQLDADVVIDGALRETGHRVAVELKLLDPARERVIWSDRYERDAADILALQADIVRDLALALRLAVRPEASGRLAVVRAVNPTVYEYYLKGRYAWNQRTPQSLDSAVAYFQRAVQLDPTYAPAHAALADCYNQYGTVMVGRGSPREWRPRAEAAAVKALQLDPYSAEAHAALGYVHHYEWRWQEAERELRRAIELNPSYPPARVWLANLLMSLRRFDESLEQLRLAGELDPFSLVVNANIGWVLTVAGRNADAVSELQRTVALDSLYPQARYRLALALMASGRHHEAIEHAQWLVARAKRASHYVSALGQAYAYAGDTRAARQLVAELIARGRHEYIPPWSIVTVLVALGDFEAAVPWTERAFEERSNALAYLAVEPMFAEFRRHPRIRKLIDQVDLPALPQNAGL